MTGVLRTQSAFNIGQHISADLDMLSGPSKTWALNIVSKEKAEGKRAQGFESS